MSISKYCKLFINSEMPRSELFNLINDKLQGEIDGIRSIYTNNIELDLIKNKDIICNCENKEDAFLFWNYFADIESQSIDMELYIKEIKCLIKHLIDNDISSVAACDFEEELIVETHK